MDKKFLFEIVFYFNGENININFNKKFIKILFKVFLKVSLKRVGS